MKDWLLIPMMLAVFVFGYYVMMRVDHFIEENTSDRCRKPK